MLLAKANHANHQSKPGHPSRMSLAEVNHQLQPGHPSQMPLAEANHQAKLIIEHNTVIHLGCH
jgi:hypothetical protein